MDWTSRISCVHIGQYYYYYYYYYLCMVSHAVINCLSGCDLEKQWILPIWTPS